MRPTSQELRPKAAGQVYVHRHFAEVGIIARELGLLYPQTETGWKGPSKELSHVPQANGLIGESELALEVTDPSMRESLEILVNSCINVDDGLSMPLFDLIMSIASVTSYTLSLKKHSHRWSHSNNSACSQYIDEGLFECESTSRNAVLFVIL